MPAVRFAERFLSRMEIWKFGRLNRDGQNNRAEQMFSFCVFTATRIAQIAGPPWKPRCGGIAQYKSGG